MRGYGWLTCGRFQRRSSKGAAIVETAQSAISASNNQAIKALKRMEAITFVIGGCVNDAAAYIWVSQRVFSTGKTSNLKLSIWYMLQSVITLSWLTRD